MAATTMVHVRVDEAAKETASATLAKMGISVSDAVRMMLVRVAEETALPFEVRVLNQQPSGPCGPRIKQMKSDFARRKQF